MNEHLLQIPVSVTEYETTLGRYRLDDLEPYVDVMPVYKVAVCPYCPNKEYHAWLDTYTIRKWLLNHPDGFGDQISQRCPHYVVTQCFINLYGHVPSNEETRYFDNFSELPYVIPYLLREDDESDGPNRQSESFATCAVMHALPICRIENGGFVPRYSLFTVIYLAQNPQATWKRFASRLEAIATVTPPSDAPDHDLWWDLEYWIKDAKLMWLDADDPELPLAMHPAQFPYGKVKGTTEPITYRHGTILCKYPALRRSDGGIET